MLGINKGLTPQANSVPEMVVMMLSMGSWVQEEPQPTADVHGAALSFVLRHSDGNRKTYDVTHIVSQLYTGVSQPHVPRSQNVSMRSALISL